MSSFFVKHKIDTSPPYIKLKIVWKSPDKKNYPILMPWQYLEKRITAEWWDRVIFWYTIIIINY